MKTRAFVGAGAGALGAATAIAALLISSGTGYAAPGPSEAFGAFITGVIDPAQPYVQSTDGSTKSESLAELPDNPLLAAKLAKVSAGDSAASVQLLGAEVLPGAEAPPELQAILDQVADGLAPLCDAENPAPVDDLPDELDPLTDNLDPAKLCEALEGGAPALVSLDAVTVSCSGDTGSVEVVGLKVFGQEIEIPLNPEPNTEIPLGPLGAITLNKQGDTDKGFNVTGVHVNLADQFEIALSSATCGKATTDQPDKPTATKPAPVTTGLPVTG